jgi:hypothetical protein
MIPITAVLNGQEQFIGYYVTLFFHGFAATNYKRVFSPNMSGLKLAYKDVWMTGAVVTIDGKATGAVVEIAFSQNPI